MGRLKTPEVSRRKERKVSRCLRLAKNVGWPRQKKRLLSCVGPCQCYVFNIKTQISLKTVRIVRDTCGIYYSLMVWTVTVMKFFCLVCV